MRALAIITGACALVACATGGGGTFQNTFVEMTESPDFVLEVLSELHEVKLGETTKVRLFLGYSYGEPDQYSYLQVSEAVDIPGVDPVAVYDLEANLGKELWITGIAAKDAKTLEVVSDGAPFLIKVDGLAAASK
ncbi:MAG: hypothetical protein HXY21_10985 [Parvularculaceae bacterium]|nr:hypothetical protein [Parvularculaceae bacterium]